MHGSWDMVRDGRTDGRKKWHIEVGAPPKKISVMWYGIIATIPTIATNGKTLTNRHLLVHIQQ